MRPIHGTIGLQPYQTFVGLFFLRPSFPITYTEIFRQSIIDMLSSSFSPDISPRSSAFLISAAISMNYCMNPAAGNALEWFRAAKPYGRSEKARFRIMLFRLLDTDAVIQNRS